MNDGKASFKNGKMGKATRDDNFTQENKGIMFVPSKYKPASVLARQDDNSHIVADVSASFYNNFK